MKLIGIALDGLALVTLLVLVLRLGLSGALPASWAAAILAAAAIVLAMARRHRSGAIRLAFRIGVPLLAALSFAMTYGGGRGGATAVLVRLGAACLTLLGLYVIVGGLRSAKRTRE